MDQLIDWLLRGDVSVRYQTHRDLLSEERTDLRERIGHEGWGARLLSKRNKEGHWGKKFYQPKWTSTHYTLLDLRNLNLDPAHKVVRETIEMILHDERGPDGGIRPIGSIQKSDVCINGMFLNYAAYFGTPEAPLHSVVDFLLAEHMPDGGFNCLSNRSGAVHSSLHSTISVLEGITSYVSNGYTYKAKMLEAARLKAIEFILVHRLFLSDRTGAVIHPEFLKMRYPCRWKYDILRALDYFQLARWPRDDRMQAALDEILKKQNKNGTWNLNAHHPGKVHFDMEKAGKPSKWNTLRCLRVLKRFAVVETQFHLTHHR